MVTATAASISLFTLLLLATAVPTGGAQRGRNWLNGVGGGTVSAHESEADWARASTEGTITDAAISWNSSPQRSQIRYFSLAPGRHEFMVRIASGDGNGRSALLRFKVEPPLHRDLWLQSAFLGAVLSALAMAIVTRWRSTYHGIQERQAERERIARDLHDTLLQGIQSLLLRIQNWETSRNIPEDYRRELRAAVSQAKSMVIEGRHQILGLRGGDSQPADLVAALEDVARGEAALGGSQFDISVMGQPRAVARAALQQMIGIAREAIRNACRHANASRISAILDFRAQTMRMSISDDGVGIDPAAVSGRSHSGHFGLIGMRERAQQLDASIYIGSNGATGTRVTLDVPADTAFGESNPLGWGHAQQVWIELVRSIERVST